MFEVFIEELLKKEGGYVNDPKDSGGETNYGITVAVARKYGYTGAMAKMPLSMAKQIYKEKYWDALNLDTISRLAPAVALKLADIGVNMGVERAGEFLQRLLNVFNREQKDYADLVIDGDVGQATIRALSALIANRHGQGEVVLERGLNCLQGAFYVSLAERRQKDEQFAFGWFLNRVA